MTISIRRAEALDIEWLLQELRAFADFALSKQDLMGDLAHAKAQMLGVIEHHLVLIAECATKGPVGFIAGLVTPHFFNPAIRTLTEIFWWVAKDMRNSRAGLLLLNAFTAWGKEHCTWISMTKESNSPVNERCLFDRGYRHFESSYVLEVC
jgi:hypothetical protein